MRSVAACVVLAACLTGACAPTGLARTPGGRLYRAKCGSCHVRPESARFDRGGWVRVLDAHRDKTAYVSCELKQDVPRPQQTQT